MKRVTRNRTITGVLSLVLVGCSTPGVDVPRSAPNAGDSATLDVVGPHIRRLAIDGERELSGHFEPAEGTHRVEAILVGHVQPDRFSGTHFKLVYDCESNVRFEGGSAYRLESRSWTQDRLELEERANRIGSKPVHGVVLELLAGPEREPVVRIPCNRRTARQVPVGNTSTANSLVGGALH